MKFQNSVQLITLAFFVFVISLAHAATPNADTLYTVQLGLFENVSIADFDDIRKAGYMYSEAVGQGEQMNIFISNSTERDKAQHILDYVKGKGYGQAFISERPLEKGEAVYVVQVASQNHTQYIDWEHYARGGQMYVLIDGPSIKITSVPFRDLEKAKEKTHILQKLGFDGAFVRQTNTLALHKVNQFNTVKEITFIPSAISINREENEEGVEVDTSIRQVTAPSDALAVVPPTPTPFSMTPKAPNSINKESRVSVKSLQRFLKEQNSYASGVDGVYGEGTAKGIALLESGSPKYAQYKVLAGEAAKSVEAPEQELTELEGAILSIPSSPKDAYAALAQQESAVAKTYQAYILFIANQAQNQDRINDLMNTAIREAYQGFEGEAPLDYQSQYAYSDLEQLILHARYVQAAVKENPLAPCWLFKEHKDEAQRAFSRAAAKGIEVDRIQNCSGFMEWDNIILLKTISTDLNVDEYDMSAEKLEMERQYASARNRLFLIPRPLDKVREEAVVAWNDLLWTRLDKRMSTDRFFAKFGVPFKLAYHKAWIELEDYYMEKGFDKHQSNVLALSVLQSVVAVDLME